MMRLHALLADRNRPELLGHGQVPERGIGDTDMDGAGVVTWAAVLQVEDELMVADGEEDTLEGVGVDEKVGRDAGELVEGCRKTAGLQAAECGNNGKLLELAKAAGAISAAVGMSWPRCLPRLVSTMPSARLATSASSKNSS